MTTPSNSILETEVEPLHDATAVPCFRSQENVPMFLLHLRAIAFRQIILLLFDQKDTGLMLTQHAKFKSSRT